MRGIEGAVSQAVEAGYCKQSSVRVSGSSTLSVQETERITRALYNFLAASKYLHKCRFYNNEHVRQARWPNDDPVVRDENGSFIVNDLDPMSTGNDYHSGRLFDAKGILEELSIEDHIQVVSVFNLIMQIEPGRGDGFRSGIRCLAYLSISATGSPVFSMLLSTLHHRLLNPVERNGDFAINRAARKRIYGFMKDAPALWDATQDRMAALIESMQAPKYGFDLGKMDQEKCYFLPARSKIALVLGNQEDSVVEVCEDKEIYFPANNGSSLRKDANPNVIDGWILRVW
ncbi:hypothetical protein BJ508DRAFT_322971 [Ascobolus immersus RN42]|uniref:Uncharacterized protein n=1 Tax=Ascobolus immersus RN42 TaxID=1160509 RepID=A0A3N4ILS2_ASCIM|nr:hypothetical protein BJ508DRAFT_322971 [Ascobolus immersus RN42]